MKIFCSRKPNFVSFLAGAVCFTLLIFNFAVIAQPVIYEVQGLKVPNLNKPVLEGGKVTWLDVAHKVFPDVMYDDDSLSRSVPIRRTSGAPLVIARKMRIMGLSDKKFDHTDESLRAVLFHVEEQYLPKEQHDILAIVRIKEKKTELLDVIEVGARENHEVKFDKDTTT